eukprot:5786294-Amphidinium_carterae.1
MQVVLMIATMQRFGPAEDIPCRMPLRFLRSTAAGQRYAAGPEVHAISFSIMQGAPHKCIEPPTSYSRVNGFCRLEEVLHPEGDNHTVQTELLPPFTPSCASRQNANNSDCKDY